MKRETSLEHLLKEHKISQKTYDKVIITKKYTERKYNPKSLKKIEYLKLINSQMIISTLIMVKYIKENLKTI